MSAATRPALVPSLPGLSLPGLSPPSAPAPTRPDTDQPAVRPAEPVVRPDERVDPQTGDGDHDRFTHYVGKRALEEARRKGTAVTALCGKRWRPDGDPSRYPMCPSCADIAADLLTRGLDD